MVNKNKLYTLTASRIAAIVKHSFEGNKICAIREFGEATGAILKDAKDVIEGNFERDVPVLKVGQKIKVSEPNGNWSYTGRIYETDGNEFKLIQDTVERKHYYSDIVVGYKRESSVTSIVKTFNWKLEILAD